MTATGRNPDGADSARLADELRLLVDMVVDRAAPWLDSVVNAGHGRGHTDSASPSESGPAPDGAEQPEPGPDGACEWCPLCAVVSLWRGERTEAAARVLDHATQLLALLRAVLADRWAPQDGMHMPGFRPPAPDSGATARNGHRVQHVSVRPRRQWEPDAHDRR